MAKFKPINFYVKMDYDRRDKLKNKSTVKISHLSQDGVAMKFPQESIVMPSAN